MASVRSAILGLLCVLPVSAITIAINDPNTTLNSLDSTVFQTKYRLSAGNFDFSLSPYAGTGATGSTWVSANAGNVVQLSEQWWAFSLTNVPGSSLTFSLTPILGNPRPAQTLIWGVGGTPTLNVPPDGTPYGPQDRAYNALRIQARASSANSSAQVTDLSFSAAGMTLTPGSAFFDMTVTPSTSAAPIPTYPADGLGFLSQWLVADGNLAAVNWTLSGRVVLTRTGGGDGEAVRFTIDGLPVSANFPMVVPEPSSWILMAAAAGALLWRKRRALSAETPPRQSPE